MRRIKKLLIACLLVPMFAYANDYSTIETVRFVVDCMVANGGQNEENLYACTCRFDEISAAFSFNEYESIEVYIRNRDMPGEKGGVFRDIGRETKDLWKKYEVVEKQAVQKCPIVMRVERPH